MFKPEKLDDVLHQIAGMLPQDLRQGRQDLEKNFRAALRATLARMDLVTREEFDVQAELLGRTRALLDELEARVARLEEELGAAPPVKSMPGQAPPE